MSNKELDDAYLKLEQSLVSELLGNRKLALVQAPPGSGKTHMLLAVVSQLVKNGKCVALAAQTNRQADDIARRWARDFPHLPATRLGSSTSVRPDGFPISVAWETKSANLVKDAGLFISTTAKWTTVRDPLDFDLLAVDEAWQMSWADLMQCATLSKCYYLIGDPGQIPPVVTIDIRRWQTAPRPPHKAAPEVVLIDPDLMKDAYIGALPACRRLPYESVEFVKPFYNFDFEAYAKPNERKIEFSESKIEGKFAEIIASLKSFQPTLITLPTPADGPALEVDSELATTAAELIKKLLTSGIKIDLGDGKMREIVDSDIGVCATHRAMNGEITRVIDPSFNRVSVDTPERWQGLERPIMIVIHPLSSVTDPSDFNLETGRLCVMASRHQIGLLILTRDHVGKTLQSFIPEATQAPGQPDIVGKGHEAHSLFWNSLQKKQRLFKI